LIVAPDPPPDPVMPPVTPDTIQTKPLGALAVKVIFGLVPLQVLAVGELVTVGVGLTVTVIGYAAPAQFPVVDIGVTK